MKWSPSAIQLGRFYAASHFLDSPRVPHNCEVLPKGQNLVDSGWLQTYSMISRQLKDTVNIMSRRNPDSYKRCTKRIIDEANHKSEVSEDYTLTGNTLKAYAQV